MANGNAEAEVIPLREEDSTTKYTFHPPEHDEVAYEQTSIEQTEPPRGRAVAILVVLVVLLAIVAAWQWVSEPEPATIVQTETIADPQTLQELEAAKSELESVGAELITVRGEIAELEQQLNQSVSAETQSQTQALLDQALLKEGDLARQLEAQVIISTSLQADLEASQQLSQQTQAQLEEAIAEGASQALRANSAEVALAGELERLPQRIENAMSLISANELVSSTYYLGEVSYELIRPGVWDDETQFFLGTGTIGLDNGVERVSAEWTDESLSVQLPLPAVQKWESALVEGQTYSEREQFARWVGRWGDQTEWFVDDVARQKTADRACEDVSLLRRGMNSLTSIVREMSMGHNLRIVWTDKTGTNFSSVPDRVLLENACG